jgi:hypothetical protein
MLKFLNELSGYEEYVNKLHRVNIKSEEKGTELITT